LQGFRETSNFLKHADKDHDAELHVREIARGNMLELGLCIVSYRTLFHEWTDHMKLLFYTAQLVFPDSFVHPDIREGFDANIFPTAKNMTLAELMSGWWNDPLVKKYVLPNLDREKAEDLQDTQPLQHAPIGHCQSIKNNSGRAKLPRTFRRGRGISHKICDAPLPAREPTILGVGVALRLG
jgi:hypothetical protein